MYNMTGITEETGKIEEDKEYNILILGMSILPYLVREHKFLWDGAPDAEGYPYCSQLEPTTRMLIAEGHKPDEVLMLCTPETKTTGEKKKNAVIGGQEKTENELADTNKDKVINRKLTKKQVKKLKKKIKKLKQEIKIYKGDAKKLKEKKVKLQKKLYEEFEMKDDSEFLTETGCIAKPDKKPVEAVDHNPDNLSAVDFYKDRIQKSDELKKWAEEHGMEDHIEELIEFIPFDIPSPKDNDSPDPEVIQKSKIVLRQAIADIAKKVISEKNSGKKVKVWIDTQGAQRDINVMLTAIFSILRNADIGPNDICIYGMDFDFKAPIQKVYEKNDIYNIFNFVSGFNEFMRYGRADQLEAYYSGVQAPALIEPMKNLADAIAMCDIKGFDECLSELRKTMSNIENEDGEEKEKNPLFGVFVEQIRSDYGKLLEDGCTGVDKIEWFWKKGLYQQALTYIESKMPREWNERDVIWMADYSPDDMTNLGKKAYENIVDFMMTKYIFQLGNLNSIIKPRARFMNIITGDCASYADQQSLLPDDTTGQPEGVRGKTDVVLGTYKRRNDDVTVTVTVRTKLKDKQNLYKILLIYKVIKEERNNFNHMNEGNERFTLDQLSECVELFINLSREFYEEIPLETTRKYKNSHRTQEGR